MQSPPGLHPRLGVVAAVALAAGIAFGCGKDATGAAPLAGKYELRTINGQPLPYLLPLGINETVMLIGRMELVSRDRLLDIRVSQIHVVLTDLYLEATTDTTAYSYRARGETLFVSHPAFDTVAAYIDTAVMAGDSGLDVHVLQRIPDSTGTKFVYRDWGYVRVP
jgi:hypothetical protein